MHKVRRESHKNGFAILKRSWEKKKNTQNSNLKTPRRRLENETKRRKTNFYIFISSASTRKKWTKHICFAADSVEMEFWVFNEWYTRARARKQTISHSRIQPITIVLCKIQENNFYVLSRFTTTIDCAAIIFFRCQIKPIFRVASVRMRACEWIECVKIHTKILLLFSFALTSMRRLIIAFCFHSICFLLSFFWLFFSCFTFTFDFTCRLGCFFYRWFALWGRLSFGVIRTKRNVFWFGLTLKWNAFSFLRFSVWTFSVMIFVCWDVFTVAVSFLFCSFY